MSTFSSYAAGPGIDDSGAMYGAVPTTPVTLFDGRREPLPEPPLLSDAGAAVAAE